MTSSWLASALAALAAAVGPQSVSSAHSSIPAFAASSTDAASAPLANTDAGNVVATVPGGSIATSDGIGQDLKPESHYRAVFQVWVAPNARHATARVTAVGAKVQGCSSIKLQRGVDNYISCEVRTTASAPQGFTLTVVATTAGFGEFSRSFTHVVRR